MRSLVSTPRGKLLKLLQQARNRARRSGLPFDLSADDLEMPVICPVLGIALDYSAHGYRHPESPSIDRVVNALGYVRGNVRVISWRANRLKSDATPEELEAVAAYARQGRAPIAVKESA